VRLFVSRHTPHTGAIALWEHEGSDCFETFLAIFELHRNNNYDVLTLSIDSGIEDT
jgi:hypothetical protein